MLHLTGSRSDHLLLRYPIKGQFEFVCETQNGGTIGTDGGLVYGGLQFRQVASKDRLLVSNADGNSIAEVTSPFARHEPHAVFNRVGIRSQSGPVAFESNSHAVWNDSASSASPWLGLQALGANRPVFRNLAIQGPVEIPESVNLISDELRGWEVSYLNRNGVAMETNNSWSVKEGVMLGDASAIDGASNLIRYQRPLLEGESIEYEFKQEGDESIPHPAFGRITFLLSSKGIRVRWITSGTSDWTCLRPDNSVLEPLSRRGGRSLPLEEKDWNRVRMERSPTRLLLHLNGTLVYERTVDANTDSKFGLYRDLNESKTSSKVRSITMTGDWPGTIPVDLLQ